MPKPNSLRRESPLVTDIEALDPSQREYRHLLLQQMRATVQETRELADGWAFRFPASSFMCLAVAQFIPLERLCCPFLDFVLEVEPEDGALWLRLTGRPGVKEFLRTGLGTAIRPAGGERRK